MILSNVEIHRALDERRLIIDPEPQPRFPTQGQYCPYDTHSVDLRLGPLIVIPEKGPYCFDVTRPGLPGFLDRNSKKITLERDRPYALEPGVFVLGITLADKDQC